MGTEGASLIALLFGAFQRDAELGIPPPECHNFCVSESLVLAGYAPGALSIMRSRLNAMALHAQSNTVG